MATITFVLAGMAFEYDDEKNRTNIKKHGIDFRSAARVFFDYDRIEAYNYSHSLVEDRYNTIGDTSAANVFSGSTVIGTPSFLNEVNDVLFVVYTDRIHKTFDGRKIDVTRIISARLATEFEKGMYYGKY